MGTLAMLVRHLFRDEHERGVMQLKKTLDESEQYSLDGLGRICPVHQMGWSKIPWKDAATFDDAITAIAESPAFQEDAFPLDDEIQPVEWSELRAKRYLDIEEGFFLAVGVSVSHAVFRFQWGEQQFFNIRPDFGFLSLATGLMEPPVNVAESKIRDRLCDYTLAVDAIQRAIQAREIDPLKLYPINWWREFWVVRGVSTLDEPDAKKGERPLAFINYSTKWLEVQQAAIAQFFNPRRNPDAKKEEVIAWINAQAANAELGESNNIASTIFTIIKPENHDPKKKRVEPQQDQ